MNFLLSFSASVFSVFVAFTVLIISSYNMMMPNISRKITYKYESEKLETNKIKKNFGFVSVLAAGKHFIVQFFAYII